MDTIDLMRRRHSVRQYLNKPIEKEKRDVLNNTANFINQKTGLSIKICYDEPNAFKSFLSTYGKFKNVNNYIVLAGDKKSEELLGYYGEVLVLTAQEMGLNTCWVGLSYVQPPGLRYEPERSGIYLSAAFRLSAGHCFLPADNGFIHKQIQDGPAVGKP